MSILARYVSRELIKVLLLSYGAFLAIYLVVDIFQGMRMFIEYKPAIHLIARLYLLKMPNMIYQATPIVILVSTLITLGLLSRNSEVIAMNSSGVSIYRIVTPILMMSFIFGLMSFLSNEYIVPYTNGEANLIEKVDIKKQRQKRFFKQNKIWYRSDKTIYNIQFFDVETNTLKGVSIYYLGDGFKLTKMIEAREAWWDGTVWIFYNARENIFSSDGIRSNYYKKLTVRLPESADTLKTEEKEAAEMGFWELRGYIEKLRNEGYDPSRFLVDLHSKLSYPFTSLIMAFLGIPFAIKSGRSSGIALGAGVSILLGFGYWLIMSFGISLGRVGALPPILAAWGANIVFGFAGILSMMKLE